MVKTITIPNPSMFQREKDLVLIPRNEYETLVRIKQKGISQVSLTRKQERAIAQSRRNWRKGSSSLLMNLRHMWRIHTPKRVAKVFARFPADV